MKQLLLLFVVFWSCSASLILGQSNSSPYLFDNFQEGTVYYKDGSKFQVSLNYNILLKCFMFLDENDDIVQFARPEMVAKVDIGLRSFIIDRGITQELVQPDPPVYVSYTGLVKSGKKTAYGGSSETSGIDSYAGFAQDGDLAKMNLPEGNVSSIKKQYYIMQEGKKRQFSTQKSFLKIYPEQKQDLLNYIKENKVDFNSINQVVQLYNYAEGL